MTFAYFPNGLLQPPNLTTRFLKICFVENFILLAPSFSGSKFGIQKFTKRPGSLFCASMGDFVVFPAMGKAHQLHFSGFKNPYPPAKGCCKGNIQPKTKYRFSMQIELVPTSSTRSCTARAVVISFTVCLGVSEFTRSLDDDDDDDDDDDVSHEER